MKYLVYKLFSGVGFCNQLFSLETAIYMANISKRKLILLIPHPLCHCGHTSWDYGYFLKMCKRDIPRDHKIFKALTKSGRNLFTPIPSFSTHTDKKDLAPLRDWLNRRSR